MDALEQRLCSLIAARERDLRAELTRHVAIPTGHNHTPGLDEYRSILTQRLANLGANPESYPGDRRPDWIEPPRPQADPASGAARIVPPTVVCRSTLAQRPANGLKRILIAGHIDTVFPPDSPFRAVHIAPDGATATGPGVVDMKGGILVALTALEALAEAGVGVCWTFLLNSDEETGSYHSDRILRTEGARHDIGIALEPAVPPRAGADAWGLAVERKGSGQFMIEVRGRSAHAGRDFDKGVSAVYALADILKRVEAITDLARGITVNVGPVSGGKATNVVPDHAAAWGNVRYPDEPAGAEVRATLEALATAPGAVPGVVVHTSFNRPAKPLTPEVNSFAEFVCATAAELRQPIVPASTGGVCDGNNLQAAGLPTLDTLGVRGGGLHTHDEWIDLSSLVERAQLMAVLLRRLSDRG